MSTKHTPGPWHRDKYGNVVDSSGDRIVMRSVAVACSGSDEYVAMAEANTDLATAAPDLLKALQWALPLARLAMEDHRMKRVMAGHKDIYGTYKNGESWVGIYQSEIDEIEFAVAALTKATA